MKPEDLGRFSVPQTPVICGRGIAHALTEMNLEDDRYERRIRLISDDGERALTAGPNDSSPTWSPDGNALAFLRVDSGRAQVAVLPADGGESRVVTDFDPGVEHVAWSPDSRHLLVVAVTWTEEWDGLDGDERERKPRRIDSVPFRFDNRGWLHNRRRHLWLVDPTGSEEPRCLTPGDFDDEYPAWSPDGSRVAFLSDHDPRRGLLRGTEVWEVRVDTGEIRQAADRGGWDAVSYRPDGVLHLVGHPSLDWPVVGGFYRVEGEELIDLTGHLDRSVTAVTTSGGPVVRWIGDDAYLSIEDAGSVGIIRVRPDATVDHVIEGRREVSGFDVSADTLAFVASETDRLPEVYEMVDGEERQLTKQDGLDLVPGHHFRVVSDGVEIDAWVYLPEGDDTVATLVSIHGGPAAQYGHGFFDEFQIYAGAGFGVIACNPRGSAGRGTEFVRAVTGEGWGVVDRSDVNAVIDAAVERFPRLDPGRIGIQGGSYGGFLTSWMIARDERFSSAVVERALLSFPSFAGTSDIGPTFPGSYIDFEFPDDWATLWGKSPLAYAHQITTPTLIVHSENDFRCPIEQAEQLFTTLLRIGTETVLLRFPGEGHELSRSGKPRHRMERFEAILDWHARLLG